MKQTTVHIHIIFFIFTLFTTIAHLIHNRLPTEFESYVMRRISCGMHPMQMKANCPTSHLYIQNRPSQVQCAANDDDAILNLFPVASRCALISIRISTRLREIFASLTQPCSGVAMCAYQEQEARVVAVAMAMSQAKKAVAGGIVQSPIACNIIWSIGWTIVDGA